MILATHFEYNLITSSQLITITRWIEDPGIIEKWIEKFKKS
jgi:hypothetical protein